MRSTVIGNESDSTDFLYVVLKVYIICTLRYGMRENSIRKGTVFLRTNRIFKESSIYVLSHVKSGAIMGKVYVTVYQGRKEYGHC